MQQHFIAGVGQGAEYFTLCHAWRLEQGEGLVAVAGEHHLIEMLGAGAAGHAYPGNVATDTLHWAIEPDMFAKGCTQRLDVAT
nr:hypothetical protein GCM10020185_78760 [Pseudomonas brassicacearum subsp. brassicacearum]